MRQIFMRLSPDLGGRLEAWGTSLTQRLPSTAWMVSAVEIVLVIACAAQLASLIWTVSGYPITTQIQASPAPQALGRPAPSSREAAAIFNGFDPFRPAAGAATGTSTAPIKAGGAPPPTSLNLELFGARVASLAAESRAIVRRPDGTQDVFAVGQQIIDSVILEAIAKDYVVIRRNGVRESLPLDKSRPIDVNERSDIATTADDRGSSAPRLRISVSPAELLQSIRVQPAAAGSQRGLALEPNGDGALFREAGFESGDVLLSIDGQSLAAPDQASLALRSTAGASAIDIEFVRAGKTIRRRLQVDR